MLSITVEALPEGFGWVDQKKLAVCREAFLTAFRPADSADACQLKFAFRRR
jgi:hypothetical protein